MPQYMWMPPVHQQQKKTCFVRQRGCPYAAHTFGCPHVLMPPVCLDAPSMFRCHHMFGCPPYVWLPHCMLDAAKCMVASKGMRDMGVSKHIGASKHMGASKCMRGIWTPPSLTKHVFFVLYMYSRHPNIFQTYGGIQTYGGVQTYGSVHTYSEGIQT